MTWKIWQAIKNPPRRHHLFQRAFHAPEEPFPWYVGCSQFVAILLVFPILAFAGAIYGLVWSVGVSNMLSKEKERGAYDLISLSPSGPFGVSWAISLGYLYHHRTFRNINKLQNLILRIGFGSAILFFFVGCFVLSRANHAPGFGLTFIFAVLALWIALYIDHIHSLVLAPLVGIGAVLLTKDRLNAQLYAFAGYLGIQLATYLSTMLVGFVILPGLFSLFGVRGWALDILFIAAQLVVLYAVRAAFINYLWALLTREMTTDPIDIRKITERKISFSSLW
jgi:hypothetical protein